MRISVFGAGYVGAVSAACLANDGNDVIAVDPNPVKTSLLNAGQSPVIEAGINEMMAEAVRGGRLRATGSARDAVASSDLALVCVGTPSRPNGDLDLTYVERVCEEIGAALRDRETPFAVIIRSTVLPGTLRGLVIPTLERASGRQAGRDFGVGIYPEFLREGTAVNDYYAPPKSVLGATDERTMAALRSIVQDGGAPVFRTAIEVAEMTKYVDNSWHAVKVAFANEMGTLAKEHGVDGEALMDIFAADTKLNISPAYLRPGFAFGGSCLPKDVRAITYRSRQRDLATPLLDAVLPSNRRHLDRAYDLIARAGHRRIGVLGLSFKAGTDDLRESPMVDLVERLIGKGFDIRIFDDNVSLARLVGANRDHLLNHIPHISRLLVPSIDDVLAHAETIVIGNADKAFAAALEDVHDRRIVDLVGIVAAGADGQERLDGLCW